MSSRPGTAEKPKQLTVDRLSPRLLAAHYEIRGRLPRRADELSKVNNRLYSTSFLYNQMLASGMKLPFDKIIYCNLGNPQQLGQPPITFYRQVCFELTLGAVGIGNARLGKGEAGRG